MIGSAPEPLNLDLNVSCKAHTHCPHFPHTPTISCPQEKPEDVPTGELPRQVLLITDRNNCNRFTPGTRVCVVGIYSTFRVRGRGVKMCGLGRCESVDCVRIGRDVCALRHSQHFRVRGRGARRYWESGEVLIM